MDNMDFSKDFTISSIYVGSPSESIPQDLYACRVCLATDIKLFDIHECDLAQSFEAVMGTTVPPDDGLPQHLCHYCFALLQKYSAFRDKYTRSNFILQTAVLLNQNITTEFMRMIDREAESLSLPLTACSTGFIDYEIIEEEADVDELRIAFQDNLDVEHEELVDSKMNIKQEIDEYQVKDQMEVEIPLVDSSKDAVVVTKAVDGEVVALDDNFLKNVTLCEDVKIEELQESSSLISHPNVRVVTLTPEQQLEEVASRRSSTAFLDALYKCDKCYRGFDASHAFRRHMMLHNSSEGPFECEVCRLRMSSEGKLRVHVASEHEKRFICLICEHRTNNCHRALKHQKVHDGKVFDCKFCGEVFKKSALLDRHVRRGHAQLVCEMCGDMFGSELALKRHGLAVHNYQATTETWLRCGTCSIELKGVDAFNKHLATADKHADTGLEYCCKHCGESFEKELLLIDHQIVHVHEDGRFHCPECEKNFPSDARLTRHFETAHAHLIENCDTIGDSDHNYESMEPMDPELDIQVTTTPKKRTVLKSLLQFPQKSDSSEKPFSCTYCSKKFKFPQYLQIHVRTHTGERPYVCNVCSMGFQAKANLNRHLKVHTGEKPYVCEICGKSFTQSNSRKVHVKTVHFKMPDPYKDRRKFYRNKNKPKFEVSL